MLTAWIRDMTIIINEKKQTGVQRDASEKFYSRINLLVEDFFIIFIAYRRSKYSIIFDFKFI